MARLGPQHRESVLLVQLGIGRGLQSPRALVAAVKFLHLSIKQWH